MNRFVHRPGYVSVLSFLFVLCAAQCQETNSFTKDKYILDLSNSGPAVWGSRMEFKAHLFIPGSRESPADSKSFEYVWFNSLSGLKKNYHSDFNDSITECFDDFLGTFNDSRDQLEMIVTVYDMKSSEKQGERVAHDKQRFYLTDSLNGALNVSQKLPHVANPNPQVFATREPIHVKLNLTDKFQDKPVVVYHWYVDSTSVKNTTDQSSTNLTFNEPGFHKLRVVANAEDALTCSSTESKRGVFQKTLILKDKAHLVHIHGKSFYTVNTIVNITADFNGSSPFRLCWKVVLTSSTIKPPWTDYTNCSDLLYDPYYIVSLSPQDLGSYSVVFSLENDVSLVNRTYNFTIYNPYPENHHGNNIIVPVICGVVAMTILILGLSYISKVKMRKKKEVEVADFNFLPTISTRKKSPVANLGNVFWNLFNRNNYEETQRHLAPTKRCYGSYDSMNNSTEQL